jgi:uncharacterized protein YfaS (alpha-2-macroglobulin family)
MTGVLVALLCFSFPLLARAQGQDDPEVTQLLADVRQEAADLAKDADEMESLLRNDVTWQTHAEMLRRVADHVNTMGRTVEKIEAKKSSASTWQQQAIDRILPLLKELAANTTAAINHINENKIRPVSGNYPEYLKQNTETAHELGSTIASFIDYGKSKEKLDKLEQKLEVAK